MEETAPETKAFEKLTNPYRVFAKPFCWTQSLSGVTVEKLFQRASFSKVSDTCIHQSFQPMDGTCTIGFGVCFPDTMVNVSLFPHVDLLCNEGNEIWIAADTERETATEILVILLPSPYCLFLTSCY